MEKTRTHAILAAPSLFRPTAGVPMRRVLAVVVVCSAVAAWGQTSISKEPYYVKPKETVDFDRLIGELENLPQTTPPAKRKLGLIDTWRYESCQTDAAKAPTAQGVFAGMRLCREKFGQ